MKNNKYKNRLLYFVTIVVVIIVYLIIHLYTNKVREDIYLEKSGYENSVANQPINNIISTEKEEDKDKDKKPKPVPPVKPEDEEEEEKADVTFIYDYDKANYIDLYNQFPTKDEVGKSFHGDKYTQDFKLKFNKSAVNVKYIITMEKLDGSDLREDWTKAFLVRDGADVKNCYRPSKKIKTFNEYENYNGNPKEKIIYRGVVTGAAAARGYEDYTFRMWVSEDATANNSSEFSNKTFRTRINVYAYNGGHNG